jgi:hypothetical protein
MKTTVTVTNNGKCTFEHPGLNSSDITRMAKELGRFEHEFNHLAFQYQLGNVFTVTEWDKNRQLEALEFARVINMIWKNQNPYAVAE